MEPCTTESKLSPACPRTPVHYMPRALSIPRSIGSQRVSVTGVQVRSPDNVD